MTPKVDLKRNGVIIAAYKLVKNEPMYTEGLLRDKLERQSFDGYLIDEAVEFAQKRNYVNDLKNVDSVLEQLITVKLYGPKRLPIELIRRGFTRELVAFIQKERIDGAESYSFPSGVPVSYVRGCAKLIRRRGAPDCALTPRLRDILSRSGYTDEIMEAAAALIQNGEGEV